MDIQKVMIRWKVYKKKIKSPSNSRNNLMNFGDWIKAIEHLDEKLDANYPKQIADILALLESEEVHLIERRI